MFMKLILLFTMTPVVELAILFKINEYIGLGYTIAIVLLTGLVGAYMAKSQGRAILSRIRLEMQEGRMPGDELLNGLCVLVGGVLLLTPGILTDSLGFILVFPITRQMMKIHIKRKLKDMIEEGKVNLFFRW
ncbi:MAG: FxsA family protein [Alkaliphilus sp.]|nr:FxsA family protein [Alkaliphilus sp.]